jgi:hypothetical protein
MGFMSDEDRTPIGSDKGGSDHGKGVARRVGNAERDEAVALLNEHWQAGRLDPAEHEQRVTRAKVAVTQADLEDLFIDLPRPGVDRQAPGSSTWQSSTPEPTGAVASSGVRGFLEGSRETIMSLTPFAALALFFLAGHHWMWFLMVPVMGILMYGPGGGKKSGRGRDRGRDRNRGC